MPRSQRTDHEKRQKHIRKRQKAKDARKWLWRLKATIKCNDCGFSHPAVIQFHHLGDKKAGVSEMTKSGSIGALIREMAKCVPLCSNCHAIRHYEERKTGERHGDESDSVTIQLSLL